MTELEGKQKEPLEIPDFAELAHHQAFSRKVAMAVTMGVTAVLVVWSLVSMTWDGVAIAALLVAFARMWYATGFWKASVDSWGLAMVVLLDAVQGEAKDLREALEEEEEEEDNA